MNEAQIEEMLAEFEAAKASGALTPEQVTQFSSELEGIIADFEAGGEATAPAMGFAPKPNYSPEQDAMIYGANKGRGMGELALEGVGTALDYGGGLVRTGIAGTSNLLGPDASIVSIEDLENALKGQAPDSDTYLGRAGMEEGPLRSTLGFIGDIGTDLSGGAQLLKAAFKGGSKLAAKGGESLYRSAFKNVDRAAELMGKGKNAFSDVARKYGLKGGSEAMEAQAEGVLKNLYSKQQQILKQAGDMGATVDAKRVLQRPLLQAEKIAAGKNIKPVRAAAETVKSTIDDVIGFGSQVPATKSVSMVPSTILDASGRPIMNEVVTETAARAPMSPLEASGIKSQLYGLLGDNAYAPLATDKRGAKLFKDAARSVKTGIESAIKKVSPELSSQLKSVNKDMGAFLSSEKVMAREASKEIAKNAVTPVDTAMMFINPALAASKKAGDILKGTAFRTYGGRALESAAPILGGVPAAATTAGLLQYLKSKGAQSNE